jgi:hypothetical protein
MPGILLDTHSKHAIRSVRKYHGQCAIDNGHPVVKWGRVAVVEELGIVVSFRRRFQTSHSESNWSVLRVASKRPFANA